MIYTSLRKKRPDLELVGRSDGQAKYNRLHLAAYSGDLDAVRELVENGIPVNAVTESPYQDQIDEKDFWDWLDWDEKASRRVLRSGGYLHPVMSPLTIALLFHPEKTELHEYLISKGAIQIFKPSVTGESPARFLENLSRI